MRDNLLFFGHDECSNPDERRAEDCVKTVLDFCEKYLKIDNAHTNIKIERAHRIGVFDRAKTRPIVVKFNHYPDKILVKSRAYEHLKNERAFRVAEQFPKAIQDRRRVLGDVMKKARDDGKKATLSYDKLYINGKMFTVDNIGTAGYI
jgi:hypothetical protein